MTARAASTFVEGAFNRATVEETARELTQKIGGHVTLGLAFVSADYLEDLEDFCELVQIHGHVPILAGCTGGGLISTGKEAEMTTGFSLLLLNLPETQIIPSTLSQSQLEDYSTPAFWHAKTGVTPDQVNGWIALCNPFQFSIDQWLKQWNRSYPGIPTVGGLASAWPTQDQVGVFLNGKTVSGAVLLGIEGKIALSSVVSQGCRPIGEPLIVTKVEENVVYGLGGRAAYEVLNEVYSSLNQDEKEKARGNLCAGLASSEYLDDYRQGDFLVRNILAANPESGAVALGDRVRAGQTMQYQLRDRKSAHHELHTLLAEEVKKEPLPIAAILFSCLGRGTSLFETPHHDAKGVKDAFGPLATAGFFCNGEIGPVGGMNFIHSYTASIAFLREKP